MILNNKNFPDLSKNRSENYLIYKASRLRITRYFRNRGVNSSIFSIYDPGGYFENSIIKICNFSTEDKKHEKRVKRFNREIDALKIAQGNKCTHVIKILHNGLINISGVNFPYYIMEKADCTLTELIETHSLDISEKVKICLQINEGLNELHNLKIYHRDLKSDNILYIGNEWKICDLGLIDYASQDLEIEEIDATGEKIGPFGWFSPEAMNKFFTEGEHRKLDYSFDCDIDYMSDIFQLGKLFWYIFQANIPVGQISEEDFKIGDNEIFKIIFRMLQYKKDRRPTMIEIANHFEPIRKRLVA